jgi:hypothetical protein
LLHCVQLLNVITFQMNLAKDYQMKNISYCDHSINYNTFGKTQSDYIKQLLGLEQAHQTQTIARAAH